MRSPALQVHRRGEGCEGDINDPCFGSSGGSGFISDGQTICSSLFTTTDTTDPANPVDTRDLDWFLFTHVGGAIDLTFAAEADMFLTVIPYDVSDPAFCDNFSQLVTYTYAPADGERADQVFAAAGDYFLVPFGIDFDGTTVAPVISRTTSVPALAPMLCVRSLLKRRRR